MQVWRGADGRLRRVVSLDAVTTDEFRALSGAGGDPNVKAGYLQMRSTRGRRAPWSSRDGGKARDGSRSNAITVSSGLCLTAGKHR
jgi:hypothetical protein